MEQGAQVNSRDENDVRMVHDPKTNLDTSYVCIYCVDIRSITKSVN